MHIAGGHGAMLGAEIRTSTDLYKYAAPTVPVPAAPAAWACTAIRAPLVVRGRAACELGARPLR